MEINFIFQLMVLMISVVAHEVAHGAMAYYFGDSTAHDQGRLTMNPIKHIDPFGSIILPTLLALTKSDFILGWAKPVPYNPYNLHPRRLGEFCVAIAGVSVNFILAVLFGLVLRFKLELGLSQPVFEIIQYIVYINLALMVFNLVPIPPLDGSKILLSFLPYRYEKYIRAIEQYGIFGLIFFIVFFSWIVSYIINYLYILIVLL
jgi:Zn-dependent protease